MVIQIDSREKAKAIEKIIVQFDEYSIKHFSSKLPIGDYMNLDNPRIVIDRKQNLSELCSNVCQDHKRFAAELTLANELGIKLFILCEHGGAIKILDDVQQWVNPRLKKSPLALSGLGLYKRLLTISKKYKVDFVFCDKRRTGTEIVRLLTPVSF